MAHLEWATQLKSAQMRQRILHSIFNTEPASPGWPAFAGHDSYVCFVNFESIARGRRAVIVGAGEQHIKNADADDCEPCHAHGPVDIPWRSGRARPRHVHDGADAIDERDDVHWPGPGAEAEFSAR